MQLQKTIVMLCYGASAVASVFMGMLYLLSPEFMPYHAAAVGMEWNQVDAELQILLLALIRVAGGAFLCVAVAVTFLLWYPFRQNMTWSRMALPLIILVVYMPTLWATASVTLHTPATAPWYGPAASIIFTLLGAIIDLARKPT